MSLLPFEYIVSSELNFVKHFIGTLSTIYFIDFNRFQLEAMLVSWWHNLVSYFYSLDGTAFIFFGNVYKLMMIITIIISINGNNNNVDDEDTET